MRWLRLALYLLRKRKWILVGCVVLGTIVGTTVWMLLPRKYESSFAVQIMEGGPTEVTEVLKWIVRPPPDQIPVHEKLIRSPRVLETALRSAGVVRPDTPSHMVEQLTADLARNIFISGDSSAMTLWVHVRQTEPTLAYNLAQGIYNAYLKIDQENRIQSLQKTREQIRDAIRQTRQEYDRTTRAVESFRRLAEVEKQIKAVEAKMKELADQFEKERANLSDKRRELNESFTDEWPEVREIDMKMKILDFYARGKPSDVTEPEDVQGYSRRWKRLREEITHQELELRRHMDAYVLKHVEISDLIRPPNDTSENAEARQKELQDRVALAERELSRVEASIAATTSPLRTLKEPVLPQRYVSPNLVSFVAVVAVLTLLGTGALIYSAELLDPTLSSAEDLAQFTQQEVLGTIPYIPPSSEEDGYVKRLVFLRDRRDLPVEPFRILKTNISFALGLVRSPVLMITASDAEEGKSTVGSNLACAFAEEGRRTVFVGGNLRRPTIHKIFSVPDTPGLIDYLEGRAGVDDILRPTAFANLWAIPTGGTATNSSVLLIREAFDRLLAELRARFDLILVDTSPVLLVTDALIIGSKADAVILVYALGKTDKSLLRRSIKAVTKVNRKLLGVVGNVQQPYEREAIYGYYRYYQYS